MNIMSHLEFEGICVIWTWYKVCVDTSPATELSLKGAVLLQSQTVSLT